MAATEQTEERCRKDRKYEEARIDRADGRET